MSHSVQFVEASCLHCRWTFAMPLLGDQSYGQFILFGEGGAAFGYLDALAEPAWHDITKRLERAGLLTSSRGQLEIDRFQRVIAASADTINGQALFLHPVCPVCHADSVSYGDSKPLEIRDVRSVTFSAYQSLSDEQKTERVCELWRQFS